jgi:hypothetical protein
MSTPTLPASMFEDAQLQACINDIRNRYGRAGLAVLGELCRQELMRAPISVVDPG